MPPRRFPWAAGGAGHPRTGYSGGMDPMPDFDAGASDIKVGLSTSSVYSESTSVGFELAGRLGYDGVEVMVGLDAVSTDLDALRNLQDYHQMPVLSVHAPTLLVLQRVWGKDPWDKLRRTAEAATALGADSVVVHPPFRWQGKYASAFVEGVSQLNAETGVRFCVENMYPWRGPRGEFKAYLPGWDPTELPYDHLTLDLSHASTAKVSALELAKSWGARLEHIHLTDGKGSFKDEHLVPGRGDQQAAEVLHHAVTSEFSGHVVLEVNTRGAGSREQREIDLVESLQFARTHLAAAANLG